MLGKVPQSSRTKVRRLSRALLHVFGKVDNGITAVGTSFHRSFVVGVASAAVSDVVLQFLNGKVFFAKTASFHQQEDRVRFWSNSKVRERYFRFKPEVR